MSADRFDDPDDDDQDYFSEVDEGESTGKSPRFFKVEDLELKPVELDGLRIDDLFSKYIGLRNQLKTDRDGWKSRESKMKSQMGTIAAILLNRSVAIGVNSLSADTGSGYQKKVERFKVAPDGWANLTAWVQTTGNFQVLQKRVSPDAVREIREADGLPPGIEASEEQTFVVRSPTARKK